MYDDRRSPPHMQNYMENDSKPTHGVPFGRLTCARVKGVTVTGMRFFGNSIISDLTHL